MKVPQGIPNPDNKVCRLRKSLYGLKQASCQWFHKLSIALQHQGFIQSKNDYSLFLKKTSQHLTIVAVYVDDMLVTGSDPLDIVNLKKYLHQAFTIKGLGSLHYFLGLEVTYVPDGVILSQRKFTLDVLEQNNMLDCKPVSTPLSLNLKLAPDEGDLLPDSFVYRALVGKLNFLTHTRPDLSFSV